MSLNDRAVLALGVVVLGFGGMLALAGNLNPPAGPIIPTMKALDEVEPRIAINATNTPGDANSTFKITQPGSYYLTGNITGTAGRHGIEIGTNDVTINLMGHTLRGVGGSLDGVSRDTGFRNSIRITNGVIRDWGGDGVDLTTSVALGCIVEDINTTGNGGAGFLLGGGHAVRGCTASSNGGDGFYLQASSTITECNAYENGGNGFNATSGCVFTGCTSVNNTASGFTVGDSCTLTHCSATQNDQHGFTATQWCTITQCTGARNGRDGVLVLSACVIAMGNFSNNGSDPATGANIHVTGNGNRLQDNLCVGADRGIEVDECCNFITGNFCSNNDNNWDVVAGNHCLVIAANYALAITGDAGGSSPGSADPNANFSQ